MKTWSFGINSRPEFRAGLINLVEMPWYLHLVEWFADNSCGWVPPIPFPDVWRKQRGPEDPEFSTLKSWYGDLEQVWCCNVSMPLFTWVWEHPKRKEYSFDPGYDRVKEMLGQDYEEFFAQHEALDQDN